MQYSFIDSNISKFLINLTRKDSPFATQMQMNYFKLFIVKVHIYHMTVESNKITNLTSRDEHIVCVNSHGVDDGVMTGHVLNELAIRELPLLQVIRRARRKRVPGKQDKPGLTTSAYDR